MITQATQSSFYLNYSVMLLQSVTVIDTTSPWHSQTVDIRIQSGKIKEIAFAIEALPNEEIWHHAGACASVGWLDMGASLNEPGYEHKDDIESLCKSAVAGGFTDLATFPNTQPVIQSKEAIQYVKAGSSTSAVKIHPMAALTLQAAGEQMTEMIDLHHAGAIAFSDGTQGAYSTAVLANSLQYLQTFGGLLIHHAQDHSLANGGFMHEGKASTMMGTKAIPSLAEDIAIAKDIALLGYTGGRLHFSMVSTVEGIELIRQAKASGLGVSCDIAAHQIAFTDHVMLDFDTNLKVMPPFRSQAAIEAIWAGIADGTVDAIVSAHQPQDIESKELEFDLADFGIIGLETAFSCLCTHCPDGISIGTIIEKLTANPRRLLQLEQSTIEVGEVAKLTLFDPNARWTFERQHIQSKSKNSPFIGTEFTGKVLGVIMGEYVG